MSSPTWLVAMMMNEWTLVITSARMEVAAPARHGRAADGVSGAGARQTGTSRTARSLIVSTSAPNLPLNAPAATVATVEGSSRSGTGSRSPRRSSSPRARDGRTSPSSCWGRSRDHFRIAATDSLAVAREHGELARAQGRHVALHEVGVRGLAELRRVCGKGDASSASRSSHLCFRKTEAPVTEASPNRARKKTEQDSAARASGAPRGAVGRMSRSVRAMGSAACSSIARRTW